MAGHVLVNELPESNPARPNMVSAALSLVWICVAFGLLTGTFSAMTGLRDNSLGVLAIGLSVLADVTGSAALVWRSRAERRQPRLSGLLEAHAASVVAIALAVVSAVLLIESAAGLASGSHPATSGVTLSAACISLAVLTPLARAKAPSRQTDGQPCALLRRSTPSQSPGWVIQGMADSCWQFLA